MCALKLTKQDSLSDSTLCLEVSREGQFLKVGLRRTDAAIWSYEDIPVSVEHVEARCRDMIDALNAVSRKRGNSSQGIKTIQAVGQLLADTLLSPRLKEKLLHTDADYLLLNLDDQIVHIPWELLDIGQGFLCERFRIGRMVKTRQQIVESHERIRSAPMRMWILANPGNDLASAGVEGFSICDITDRMNEHETVIDTSVDSEVTRDHIMENLKNFDMVHFAGHADFDSQNPEQSGWRLKNGNFKAIDIHQMMGGRAMPSLVFSNACQSARTQAWTGQNIENSPFGLANAFMLAGVRHYIGTSWDIIDEPSSRFAQNFYKYLLSGMTVGEAVRQTRQGMMTENDDICWASYVLYGNPTERYFEPAHAGAPNDAQPVIPISIPDNPPNISRSSENESVLTDAPSEPPVSLRDGFKKSLITILCIALMMTIVFIGFRKIRNTDAKDEWTSQLLSLAVIFEPQSSSDNADADRFSAAIESGLKDFHRVKLVNRMELDIIKREIGLWMSEYIDPKHKLQPKLLPAMLILYLKVIQEDSKPLILMRLLDTGQGTIQEIFAEKVERHASLTEQKNQLSEIIVKKLKERYPIRGRVTNIENGDIILNIGADVGVDMNQQFKVQGKAVMLEVISLKTDSCIAKPTSESAAVQKGWKVAEQ
jgi:CHAT domain-containing protein